jgi:rubrerythrin
MSTIENLERNFKGETTEVGLYLAMAKRAEMEGYPQIALYLKQVAMDEAYHAAEIAEYIGLIGNTKENLEKMLKGETAAGVSKAEAAKLALEEGNLDAASFFTRAAKDEERHAAGLKAYLRIIEAHNK